MKNFLLIASFALLFVSCDKTETKTGTPAAANGDFKTAYVDVEHASRQQGESNYNLKKMLNLALDIILAFSDKPLRLIIKLGMSIAFISILMAIYAVYSKITGDVSVSGYASLITSIWFLSGCILITLGVIGLYVGKTFEGVKNRPIYIVEKKVNEKE